ncbi:hypothetical protein OAC89_05650 [Deltaproteobacteria bacterium]|nr:hypothetical protein [Deltaproteobacteria bacterium]
MRISKENYDIRSKLLEFEQRTEEMHQDFYKYLNGLEQVMPNWEGLEKELVLYSRRKILDLELSKNLDRVLYKFQNRKKIWLAWVEELHHLSKKEEETNGEAEEEEDHTEEVLSP